MTTITDQQRAARVRALLQERAGYEKRGLTDRVNAVDEQLRWLGAEAELPHASATKRAVARASSREQR